MNDLIAWEKEQGVSPVGKIDVAQFSWLIQAVLRKERHWRTLAVATNKGYASMCIEALKAHYDAYTWRCVSINDYNN